MRSLEDLRVLDISRALAGPYCCMMLGDLGADVIKVELPDRGDDSRNWGPPFVGKSYASYPGESAYFMAINRNKRSITINLKSPEGQEIIKRLASESDVFVENYRTGTLEKMGLGYGDLRPLNSRLIYCSISGYGRNGPYADRPGYDFTIQAEGGIMGVTGPEEGPPYRVGISLIDITTGMFASTAILAALHARESSGEGQLIDVSLLDTSVALLANVASNYLVGGVEPKRMGNAHFNIAPYEVYKARDHWFTLGAANTKQWELLCEVIDQPELKDDPRFVTNQDRVANRAALAKILSEAFAKREAKEWLTKLQEADIPSGPINTIQEVFSHPQASEREFRVKIEHPTAGPIDLPGFPYKMSGTPANLHRPPPMLGEHTEEVLMELLGYSAEKIASLKERKVI
ncbi:MAG TPA: CoA transferase [Anaerolineales bacterium]|nr:CoA transferase [Anaerolineales bacterium]